tara:strand:- start:182 stop:451 length:270 start_codon:yes stop_codon:yes gene_type:complete
MKTKVRMFKLEEETRLYNKNQKVWVVKTSGSGRWLVTGKHRGKGRYVQSWVKVQEWTWVEVDVEWAKGLDIECHDKVLHSDGGKTSKNG